MNNLLFTQRDIDPGSFDRSLLDELLRGIRSLPTQHALRLAAGKTWAAYFTDD